LGLEVRLPRATRLAGSFGLLLTEGTASPEALILNRFQIPRNLLLPFLFASCLLLAVDYFFSLPQYTARRRSALSILFR